MSALENKIPNGWSYDVEASGYGTEVYTWADGDLFADVSVVESHVRRGDESDVNGDTRKIDVKVGQTITCHNKWTNRSYSDAPRVKDAVRVYTALAELTLWIEANRK